MTSETAALSYGFASAIVWGAADFNGGLAAKKGQLMGVVVSSQMIGGVFMVLAAVITSEPIPPLSHLLYGGLAAWTLQLCSVLFIRQERSCWPLCF